MNIVGMEMFAVIYFLNLVLRMIFPQNKIRIQGIVPQNALPRCCTNCTGLDGDRPTTIVHGATISGRRFPTASVGTRSSNGRTTRCTPGAAPESETVRIVAGPVTVGIMILGHPESGGIVLSSPRTGGVKVLGLRTGGRGHTTTSWLLLSLLLLVT
jgi:hypothetical protein